MRGKLIVVAAACVAALLPPGAAAAPHCGTAVLKDWSDGKLDRAYPVRCYQDALNRMPEDMRSYTTAPDDIRRALLARLRAGHMHHDSTAGTTRTRPATTPKPAQKHVARHANRTAAGREALSPAGLDATSSPSIPRPLVALAAIGALLLTGGSVGLAARRLRS